MDDDRNGRQEAPDYRQAFEQLREPDLSIYLALRAQYGAAKVRAATWADALQVLHLELWARYGLRPEDGIDPRGRIQRTPRELEEIELPIGREAAEIQP